jgi:uncharacterized protein (TIGR00251 family)
MKVPVRDTRDGTTFMVRVTPRAGRTAIAGVAGEGSDAALKIALHAPPIEGRANMALIEFLSELLGTPRSTIEIAGGQHGRNKRIIVRGRSATEVANVIENALFREK